MKALKIIFCLFLLGTPLLGETEVLTLLSPHWEGIRNEYTLAFKKHMAEKGRKVKLKWLNVGGTSDILRFIRSEYKRKPTGIGVDLFFGGGTDPYIKLQSSGLLEAHEIPQKLKSKLAWSIGGIPLHDKKGHWYSVTMAGFGILYNKAVLKRLSLPVPETWEDLAHPRYRGWISSADPRKSGSVHMVYEILLQAYGWEKGWKIIAGIAANVRGFRASSSQTAIDVSSCEVALSFVVDFYAWAQIRQVGAENIGYLLPPNMTIVNGDAIALLKGAPERELAKAFIDFCLSRKSQRILIQKMGSPGGPRKHELEKFSVHPDIYAEVKDMSNVKLNPFTWKSNFIYDPKLGSRRWRLVNDLMGATLIDPHGSLSASWKVLVSQHGDEADITSLYELPLNEMNMRTYLEEGKWKDRRFRSSTIVTWRESAKAGHHKVYQSSSLWQFLPLLFGLGFAAMALNQARFKK